MAEAHRDGSDEGSNEAEGTQSAGLHDESLWELAQRSARRAGKQLSEWGVLSPRFLLAGGGLFMTLSNWGFLPQVRAACCFQSCSLPVPSCDAPFDLLVSVKMLLLYILIILVAALKMKGQHSRAGSLR